MAQQGTAETEPLQLPALTSVLTLAPCISLARMAFRGPSTELLESSNGGYNGAQTESLQQQLGYTIFTSPYSETVTTQGSEWVFCL